MNYLSKKQQGGEQVEPELQQLASMISSSVEEGMQPIEVIVKLRKDKFDALTITKALTLMEMPMEEIVPLLQRAEDYIEQEEPTGEEITQNPEQLARMQEMESEAEEADTDLAEETLLAQSGIEIKPENKGKFTKWAKQRGMTVKEAYNKVMSNTDEYPPSIVKMANFAKNAAGWNKQDGGEQTPEMKAYLEALEFNKQARQAIGTNNKEELQNLSLNKPYNNNNLARDFSELQRLRKAAGLGMAEEASILFPHVGQQIRGSINDALDTTYQQGGAKDGRIRRDMNWISSPKYVDPILFKGSNDNFSLAEAAYVAADTFSSLFGGKDRNEDGLKDGFFKDIKSKRADQTERIPNYYDYNIKLDPNDPNEYQVNPQRLFDASKGEALKSFTDEGIDTGTTFGYDEYGRPIAKAPDYEEQLAKQKKIENSMGSEFNLGMDIIPNTTKSFLEMAYGGDIPKAQFGTPTGLGSCGDGEVWDFMQQKCVPADVNASLTTTPGQLTANLINNQSNPNTTFNQIANTGNTNMSNPNVSGPTGFVPPEVERTNKLQGLANRVMDSRFVEGFAEIGDFAVSGANVINDWFKDKRYRDAEQQRDFNLIADQRYATAADPVNKRGFRGPYYDAAETDYVTGLYAKNGGGIDNPGFRALPPRVQENIKVNMKKGGEFTPHIMYDPQTGEGYKAEKYEDHVKMDKMGYVHDLPKAQYGTSMDAFMGYAEGGEIEVDSDMLAKLIAAGADISFL